MKKFISNFLLATVFFILLLILFVYAILPMITNHGKTVRVPKVSAMHPDKAAKILKQKNLTSEVADSVYDEEMKANAVISQDPEPGDQVKVNREIDLVINKTIPPEVNMPALVNKSFELARYNLKSAGLELGQVLYKPFYVDSLVLEQKLNGQPVPAGNRVHLTTAIDLVVGYISEETVLMPDLQGMSLQQASHKLEQYQLILNPPDDKQGIIQRQYPAANTSVSKGTLVEVVVR